MFSAIFLVCVVNEPCVAYANAYVFPSYEECMAAGTESLAEGQQKVVEGVFKEHTAELVCYAWDKA